MPEVPKSGLRIAIYARVSTEEQREGQTIDSQVSELERFSREKGWPIVGIYKDKGWSGGVMERPDLDRLRDNAQKAVFDAVLINDVDRLARDVAHLGVIKRDLEHKGIQVIFRKLPTDTSPTYNLMVNILGSFAEFEREMISDRTRRGRRHKVEVRKRYLGSNTSYGYRYLPMDHTAGREGVLQVAAEEAAMVRRMFEWVDEEGLSARRVLTRLAEVFASGTAAVITGLRRLRFERGLDLEPAETTPGTLTTRLLERLQAVQYGRTNDNYGWLNRFRHKYVDSSGPYDAGEVAADWQAEDEEQVFLRTSDCDAGLGGDHCGPQIHAAGERWDVCCVPLNKHRGCVQEQVFRESGHRQPHGRRIQSARIHLWTEERHVPGRLLKRLESLEDRLPIVQD